MADVPLPDVPCVRCRLDYQDLTSNESGNRFYLSYSGSAPTAANCVTLAGDIASAWNTWFGGLTSQNFALVEVDVLDIASDSGLSGQWAGTYNGGQTGTPLTLQSAINVEFLIARRYRGCKPRIYLPPTTRAGSRTRPTGTRRSSPRRTRTRQASSELSTRFPSARWARSNM